MPFVFSPLRIPEVVLVLPKVFADPRGSFFECYKESDFQKAGISWPFVQDNASFSGRGTLRGIHFQKEPHAQGKLVSVFRGAIWDVAVDLRRGSPTFRQWVACELTEKSPDMLYIPPGFGHGFVALSETAGVRYKCTAEYAPQSEAGVRWDDPELAIDWPVKDVLLSPKDAVLPALNDAYLFP